MTLVLRVIIANLEKWKPPNVILKVFEIDSDRRKATLDDEDLKPFWDSLQTTVE
jgi:hypothetical protein